MPSSTSLLLSASRSSWAASPYHGTEWDKNPRMVKMRSRILRRDRNTCQGCGWQSERWQEIHQRNDDHRDFRESNLETLCPLCHQVFHLPLAASTCGGTIIWQPDISQATLNLLCIPLFVAMKSERHEWAAQARRIYNMLKRGSVHMSSKFTSSDPGILAQALLNLPPERYAQREKMVGMLRLLPMEARFQSQIDYWEAAHFRNPPPERWEEVLPANFNPQAAMPEVA